MENTLLDENYLGLSIENVVKYELYEKMDDFNINIIKYILKSTSKGKEEILLDTKMEENFISMKHQIEILNKIKELKHDIIMITNYDNLLQNPVGNHFTLNVYSTIEQIYGTEKKYSSMSIIDYYEEYCV